MRSILIKNKENKIKFEEFYYKI